MNISFSEENFLKPTIMSSIGAPIPVGNVLCIGRNYRKHLEELNSKDLGEPVVFTKPASAVCQGLNTLPLPAKSDDVHHEVELALIIGKSGKDIPQNEAREYIAGSAVALDLTMRDIQGKAKKNGTPWAIAKGFDYSCPISSVHPETDIDTLSGIDLFLEKNGQMVQQGNTANMIFPLDFLLSYLSGFFTLNPGDIILTGTPEGVGPVKSGDVLTFWSSFSERISIRFT